MNKQLTVYKASAGSGKTFTLAAEYIKLLIQNPNQYRNILAVTFTNKATEEMKQRILAQLYGIWRQLDDSATYMKKVIDDLHVTAEIASRQAGIALDNLLHHYSYFRVETIDAFFQRVLRNLARELDLAANMHVGLNDKQVEDMAVDAIVEELKQGDEILEWLIRYIEENMDEDKGWNVIGQIKRFGLAIFNDSYKSESRRLSHVLSQKDAFGRYVKKLRQLKDEAKKLMESYAQRFDEALDHAGLSVDDLSNKSRGIASYFRKLASNDFSDKNCMNSTLVKHLESGSNWTPKSSPRCAMVVEVAETSLLPLLREAERQRSLCWKTFVSATLALRHLNQVRLLSVIEQKVHEINQSQNRFLLSDTQNLLQTFISPDDSPFVFEKIGTDLEHIMIDEFQDTSTVQWNNFKVLLLETMSHQHSHNLIVGDVKQSIYRWREGDWRLLNDIEGEFKTQQSAVSIEHLDCNYRSSRRVVEFNNMFFSVAKILEYQLEYSINPASALQLLQAYADVVQHVPTGKADEGFVRVRLFSPESGISMLDELVRQVDELLDAGVPQNKIAILFRYNKHIPLVANHFVKERSDSVRLVSDEAFRLDASLAVLSLVAAVRLLLNPDNVLFQQVVQEAYRAINGSNSGCTLLAERDDLLSMPLTDMLERIFCIFHMEKLPAQSAYISKFFDEVNSFIDEIGPDPWLLLDAWDETLHEKTIQSDEADGIRLISIHKAKGLEFDSVVLPWCDWRLSHSDTIWCHTDVAPFSDMPILPIDYSDKLKESIFSPDWQDEHLQVTVDNLNLLYVAFTRACRNLIVLGKRRDRQFRSHLIEQSLSWLTQNDVWKSLTCQSPCDTPLAQGLLKNLPSPLSADQVCFSHVDGDTLFEYGHISVSPPQVVASTQNIFLMPALAIEQAVCSYPSQVGFMQSNDSRQFIESNDIENERQQYIKTGNVLHALLSRVRCAEDLPKETLKLQQEGVAADLAASIGELTDMLAQRMCHPIVAQWFSPRWTLFNECTLLSLDDDGTLRQRRPDRVMTDGSQTIVVDFKFAAPRQQHADQVREYIQLLRNMNHPHVKGYLWYVYSNIVDEVK